MFILIGTLILTLIMFYLFQFVKLYKKAYSQKVIKKNLLFSFGSNSIKQLKLRLNIKDELTYFNAYIKDNIRIFAGISKKWNNGGVASIYPSKGNNVYGIAVELSDIEMSILDAFENGYTRNEMKCIIADKEYSCFAYIKTNHEFKNFPSTDYLKAINCMLNNRYVDNERKILIKGIVKGKPINFGYWTDKEGLLLKLNNNVNVKCKNL